mmetsp:Transcript_30849/g.98384  ORF Transcript_30849/g.98384 Transcript_30849/m.98384 type:complete len:200 (-) Transcript_30849:635-1234(-)
MLLLLVHQREWIASSQQRASGRLRQRHARRIAAIEGYVQRMGNADAWRATAALHASLTAPTSARTKVIVLKVHASVTRASSALTAPLTAVAVGMAPVTIRQLVSAGLAGVGQTVQSASFAQTQVALATAPAQRGTACASLASQEPPALLQQVAATPPAEPTACVTPGPRSVIAPRALRAQHARVHCWPALVIAATRVSA